MISLKNVSLVFQGGSVAISNISTEVKEGEFVYLVGHSGSGKSSFLKYMGKDYIFNFVEDYPGLVFDGKFFNLTYEGYENVRMRQGFLDDYMGSLRDVRWIINDLVDKTPDEVQNEKNKVIRAKLSLAYLDEHRV